MAIGIDIFLLICAAAFAILGVKQLRRSSWTEQNSLDAFTKRRNAVSCICLAILFVTIVICVSL